MVRKPFSKELYAQNDAKAKKLAKAFFAKLGIELEDHPKRYDVDLVRTDGEGFVECEIKNVWKDEPFPYESVQFPERKAKYVYKNDKPVTFFMLNSKCNRCLTVKGEDLLKSPLKEVWNKYMRGGGEMFFQVPLDKVEFHDIED